nr:cation diffusion facilitator family transporter [Zhaonella formicivorans]
MTGLLIKTFIKHYDNTRDVDVRKQYGTLAGAVGVAVNLLLFVIKLSIGLIVNSIAVIADSFNNLSDMASSVVTIIGFRLANKPADPEHPFGHKRIEYIAGLIVAFLVILIGFEFFQTSFQRILNPVEINFNLTAFLVLLVSISFKVWLAVFNKKLARMIDSKTLEAASADSIGDVLSSSCIALSLLISLWTPFPIDGYVGLIVAGIIFFAGINLTKDTISPLLGEAPPEELVKKITGKVLSYEGIIGTHDLIVHSYGPGNYMASIHAEVPSDMELMEIHEIIDTAEKEISKELNILLTIHMDPVNMDCELTSKVQNDLQQTLGDFPEVLSFHDLRIVGEGKKQNLIFDVVVDAGFSKKQENELKQKIAGKIKRQHPLYECIITVDRKYA